MKSEKTLHFRFVSSFFTEEKNQDLINSLPKNIIQKDSNDQNYTILKWYTHKDTNIYIPMIEVDNQKKLLR